MLAIAATALALATSTFQQTHDARRLGRVAARLETDLQHARRLAVARNET